MTFWNVETWKRRAMFYSRRMGIIEKFENGGHKRSYETDHLFLASQMSKTPIQQNFPVQNWVND